MRRRARLGVENIEQDAERLKTLLGASGAWILLEETILTGSQASVSFTSIPQIYRAIVLVSQVRTDASAEGDHVLWRANGDSANNYDRVWGAFRANVTRNSGGNNGTSAGYAARAEAANSRASNFGLGQCWWTGYALADREKQSVNHGSSRFGNRGSLVDLRFYAYASAWRNTAVITSLTLLPDVGSNFVSGSRFTWYGVL